MRQAEAAIDEYQVRPAPVQVIDGIEGERWMDEWHMNSLSNTELARYYDSMDFERRYTYDGGDLGCTYTPEKTTWKIWSRARGCG